MKRDLKLLRTVLLAVAALMAILCTGCVHHEGTVVSTVIPGSTVVYSPAIATRDALTELNKETDPWSYCEKNPFSSYPELLSVAADASGAFNAALRGTFAQTLGEADLPVVWRCMDGKVYACSLAAHAGCAETVDLSASPTEEMLAICEDSAMDGVVLPADVVGENNGYQWTCSDGLPAITGQGAVPDPLGYNQAIWFEIPNQLITIY